MRFVALALVFSIGFAEAGSPVSKVIELLKDLKDTVENEGAAELKAYSKYACWCRDTTQRKIDHVKKGKEEYETQTINILKATAQAKHSQAMIEESEKRLEANANLREEKTNKRKEEMTAYMTNREELVEAIEALHKAIGVLDNPTEKKGAFISMSRRVQGLIEGAQSLALTEDSAKVLRNFIQAPEEFYQTGSKYAPQSGSINGILRDMYRQFAIQLQQETSADMRAQHTYEELMDTLAQEQADLEATKEHHENKREEANQMLADETAAREENHASIKAAQVFFKNTVEGCHSKANDWNVRRAQRKDELTAINMGLKILSGNDALFDEAANGARKSSEVATSLLEIGSLSRNQQITRSAVRILTAVARQTHSVRVASIAAMLQTGGAGDDKHRGAVVGKGGLFDEVIKSIGTMIEKLDKEARTDSQDLKKCEADRAQLTLTKTQGEAKEKAADTKHAREEALKAKADDKVAEEKENQADVLKERNEANGQFESEMARMKKEIEKDTEAIKVINQAIKEMARFYKCGSFLQKRGVPIHEDAAPTDAKFSDKFNNCGKGSTIINMMQQIVQDMDRDIKDNREAMANDTADNTKMNAGADDADNASKASEAEASQKSSNHNAEMTEAAGHANDGDATKDTAQAGIDKIKKSCDFIVDFFDQRTEHRKKEKKGLEEAMHILSSA